MAKLHADKAAGCISHTKFTPADIARLEARVASLKETHEFDDENHAYIEAATRISHEARGHSESILAALNKEDKAKAAAVPPAPPELPKFDNIPDLADAVAKENGFPQAVAEAYVQHSELGRSHAKIAKTLGVGKSTAHEMVTKMTPLMDAAKVDRLEKGAATVATEAAPVEAAPVEEAAPDQKAAADETVDEDAPAAPAEELTASGELADEDNPSQGQEPRTEQGHVNISDSPHGEGETKAKNDETANKAYKGKIDPVAKARWEALSNALPPKKRVAWDELGPGQQAGFSDEAKKGKADEAFASTMAMAQEGIKLATAQDMYMSPAADGKIAGVDGELTRATDMVGLKLEVVLKKYPMLNLLNPMASVKSSTGRFTYSGLDDDQVQVVGAALHNLLRSAASPFVQHAMSTVKYFGAFIAGPKDTRTGAAYISGLHDTIIFNQRFVPSAFDSRAPLLTTVHLVHELTHAADMTPTGDFASMSHTSPTKVSVDYLGGDKVQFKMNPVAQEAFKAFFNNQLQWKDFTQAFGRLALAIEAIADNNGEAGTFTDEDLAQLAENATTELHPKLMELYLSAPNLLKQLPLAYAHAQAISLASSSRAVHEILGGSNVAKSQTASAANGVPRQVQVAAVTASDAGADTGPVPETHRAVGEGRQGSPGPGGAGRGGRTGDVGDVPPPITGRAGILNWLKALTEGKWRTVPSVLGFLSTEQMADRWKDIPMVKKFSDTMAAMGGRANAILAESDKHSTQWSALRKRFGPGVETKFSQMLLDATTANTWPDRDIGADGNKHLSSSDSTVAAEHARLRNEYRALPAEYQALFHSVVADEAAHRAASIAGLRRGIVEAYHPMPGKQGPLADTVDAAAKVKAADRAAFLAANAKTANDATVLNKLWSDLDEHGKTFPTLPGPYFPKMRFGDHIVSYKTKTYQAQEAAVAHANEVLQGLLAEGNYAPVAQAEADIKSAESRLKRSTKAEHRAMLKQDIADSKTEREALLAPIAAARKLLAEQQNKLMLMKADGAHYGVEFYENRALAMANQERLAAHFGTEATVHRDLKDQFLRSMDGVTPEFVRTLEHKMSQSLNGVDAVKVSNAVRELYLRLQPENSALKRQLKRANVSGVRADEAQRAYATSAMRSAHAISRLEYGDALHRHLNEMRYNRTDEDTKLIGNELAKRIAQNLSDPSDPRMVAMLTNGTYLTYLGMSPAFMVTQLTQPWVISAPIMAGKHGIRTTGRLLSQASVDAAKLLKGSYDADKRWKYHLDPQVGVKDGIITADEAKMLQEMLDRGRIDITITHDMGATSAGSDHSVMAKAAAIASYPAQQLEMMNRVSTALAGYRAEREKGTQHMEAAQYADTLVADTHLNYSAANRARFMHANALGGYGRVMFQFRAYQQGMLYLLYKNIADGMRGDKNARKSVAYLAGMQLATAGVAGMPVPGVVAVALSMLYKSFTDDDDEKDLKEMMFQGVKSVLGETGATAAMKGIPAALGVDMSAKVGLGNIAEAVPYANDKKVGSELVKEYFAGLAGGASLGVAMNWANAAHEASQGNFLKAAGQAAPVALANPIKAVGYTTHGMVDSRGNQVLAADEMSAAAAAIKAVGFQPTEVARVQDQRGAFFEAKKNRNDTRAKLISDFARARTEGSDPSSIREDVAGFNERHPDDRITPATLEKAVALQRIRTRNLRHGVPIGKHDRALAEELGIE